MTMSAVANDNALHVARGPRSNRVLSELEAADLYLKRIGDNAAALSILLGRLGTAITSHKEMVIARDSSGRIHEPYDDHCGLS